MVPLLLVPRQERVALLRKRAGFLAADDRSYRVLDPAFNFADIIYPGIANLENGTGGVALYNAYLNLRDYLTDVYIKYRIIN